MSTASFQFQSALQMMHGHADTDEAGLSLWQRWLQRCLTMAARHAELSYGSDLRTLPHF
jgi:hypothetical protein